MYLDVAVWVNSYRKKSYILHFFGAFIQQIFIEYLLHSRDLTTEGKDMMGKKPIELAPGFMDSLASNASRPSAIW